MTALVLDAGALIAVDRGDRDMHDKIEAALRVGDPVRTNPNAVAQVWRDGAKQARLAKALHMIEVAPMTVKMGTGRANFLARRALKMSWTRP